MRLLKHIPILCFASAIPLISIAKSANIISDPWMTGPLLAPAGVVVPAGHINWEPYIFVNDRYGHYSSGWGVRRTISTLTTTPELVLTAGLCDRLDFEAILPYKFKSRENSSANYIGDQELMLGYQVIAAKDSDWYPNLRVTLIESFPTGRYQNLNPARSDVDSTGSGSYATSLGFNFQKSFHFMSRVLRGRLSLTYTAPASVEVAGFNTYGGGYGTLGTVQPGGVFSTDFGLEFTLTQHWVPALDVVYIMGSKTTFSGTPGITATGQTATLSSSSNAELTVAPAIEYNFSAALGIIAGVWFSVDGRNTEDFKSVAIAVNYYN